MKISDSYYLKMERNLNFEWKFAALFASLIPFTNFLAFQEIVGTLTQNSALKLHSKFSGFV